VIGAVAVLSLCLFNGYRLEAERVEANTARQNRFVRLGDTVDLSQLKLVTGTTTVNATARPLTKKAHQWTLLVFSTTACQYCSIEFEALKKISSQVRSNVRIINVVQGQAIGQSPEAAARSYAASHRLPFESAIDPDTSFGVLCGSQGVTPYSVLLDSQNRVRYSFSGYVGTPNGSSVVAEDVSALAMKRAISNSQLLWNWRKIGQFADLKVTTATGVQTSLEKLSADKLVVITSVKNDGPSRAKLEYLRRFMQLPELRFVCVNISGKPLSFRSPGFIHVEGMAAQKMSRRLEIEKAPASAVIFRRRMILWEKGPVLPGSYYGFDRFLTQNCLFSEPVLRAANAAAEKGGTQVRGPQVP
jgi:hypothetical protein